MFKNSKLIALLILIVAMFVLVACGNNSAGEPADEAAADDAQTEAQTEETTAKGDSTAMTEKGTLVVYFSATGTTKAVAEKIASITGADTYEIKAAQEYTDADLDWNDKNSRTTKEQNDPSARPEIGSDPVSLEGYSTIYIGYPIWWGEEPRIMDTFVENNDFAKATVIPFCTSGSSDIGSSDKNLADNAGSGNWLEGARFSGSFSEDELKTWIEELQ